jgi:hypothetical protein
MTRLKKLASNGIKARAWQEEETNLWHVQPQGCVYFDDNETEAKLGITENEFYQARQGTMVLSHPMDEGACWKTQEEAQKVADNINQMLGL